MRKLLVVVLVAGCGDDGGAAIDAPGTDAEVDAAPPIDGRDPTANAYVIDDVNVPELAPEVQAFGMDLDSTEPTGDVGVDNQLGQVISALTTQGLDVQTSVSTAVSRGVTITLIYNDPVDVAFETMIGSNPVPPACSGSSDTVCRHHLDGHGAFAIATAEPTGTMPTTLDNTTTNGGPGTAVLGFVLGGDGATPVSLTLIGARFSGEITATGIDGVLAGAISDQQVEGELIPSFAAGIQALYANECSGSPPPECGCPPGSTSATYVDLFDDDDNCVITVDEVQNDSLVQSFFDPDVTIGGVDALSLGVRITAVPAAFTPP